MDDHEVFQGIRNGKLRDTRHINKLITSEPSLKLSTIKVGFYNSTIPAKSERPNQWLRYEIDQSMRIITIKPGDLSIFTSGDAM